MILMRLLYTRSEVGQHTAYIDQCTQSFDRDGPCIRSLRTKLSFPYDFYPSTHPSRRGLQLPAVFSSGGANLSQKWEYRCKRSRCASVGQCILDCEQRLI